MPDKIGHSIDGIEEYDNPIPAWLMWILYATIAIAAVYWVLYPGFWRGVTGWDQAHMYEEEMEDAAMHYTALKPGGIDIAGLVGNPKAIEEGREIFSKNCTPCHGADAKGGIGPNLTDKEWLYGGAANQIAKTVSNGTDKGMPPWQSLGQEKVMDVAVYVHSLGGGQ